MVPSDVWTDCPPALIPTIVFRLVQAVGDTEATAKHNSAFMFATETDSISFRVPPAYTY